jgi:hypothetical protein
MASRATAVRARDLVGWPPPPRRRPADPSILHLRQARDLLRSIGDADYIAATPLLPGGSVGKHLRHCLDLYGALARGLRTGDVDYGRRRRDPAVESSREAALAAVESIERKLSVLEPIDLDRPLLVRDEVEVEEAGGEAGSRSTIRRELHSHTIHHYALMGMILRTRGFEPPPSFGVSPSTLRHRERSRLRRV